MKNIITALILCGGLLSASGNFTIVDTGVVENVTTAKVQALAVTEQKEYIKVKIKDGGVLRTMLVEKKRPKLEARSISSNSKQKPAKLDKLNSKVGIIVSFKDKTTDIDTFASRYNIKLKTKMKIGYYIFENSTSYTDIVLIQNILADDTNNKIDTIRPNWPMDVVIQ